MSSPSSSLPTRSRIGADSLTRLSIGSALAYLIGLSITLVLHETAHNVAGLVLGYQTRQVPFAVTFSPDPTTMDSVIQNLAGPLFSLVLGLVLIQFRPVRQGFWAMVWLWFSFTCAMEGISYFCLTPLGVGDTGAVAASLGWGLPISITLAALGVAGIVYLVIAFARQIAPVTRDIGELRAVAFYGWLIAAPISAFLAVGWMALSGVQLGVGDTIAVIMANIALGVYGPMAISSAAKRQQRTGGEVSRPLSPMGSLTAGYLVLAALLVMNLALTRGLVLG